MPSLKALLPDAEAVLALEPEELAAYLLEHLNALPTREQENLNRYNFCGPESFGEYRERREDIAQAIIEAWVWLEREGLLVPKPGAQDAWRIISRRGRTLKLRTDVDSFRKARRFPPGLLHPQIAAASWSEYLRGDYESAVFKAFKEVEIAVRAAGGYAVTDLGVDLMRKAFHPSTGLLTDMAAPVPEREARAALFAGAIGSYKNPPSHRRVPLDAEETGELMVFAGHLLRIVEARGRPHEASSWQQGPPRGAGDPARAVQKTSGPATRACARQIAGA